MATHQHNENNEDHKHHCSETLHKVELALDGELTSREEELLIGELNNCSHCAECYEVEKAFKEYLHSKVQRRSIPVALIADIRTRIHSISQSNT